MRPAMRWALLWQAVGWLCYLAGLLLFVSVAVGLFLAPPRYSFTAVAPVDLAALLGAVGLLAVGRAISVTLGGEAEMVDGGFGNLGDGRPEQSRLEELGYRVPPEPSEGPSSGYAYEDGEVLVVCEECGAKNDHAFEYCRDCSSALPE